MNEKTKVSPVRLGAIIALTLATMGLIFGIFGFIAMDMASDKVESSMGSVFTFMKHSETNIAMFGGMTVRIGKYIGDDLLKEAELEKDEEAVKKIKKIFPQKDIEEYEVEDIKNGLEGIHGAVVSQIQSGIGSCKWLMLFGFIFGFGILGFLGGFFGGKFYNLIEK